MIRLACALLFCLSLVSTQAAEARWLYDIPQAQAQAKKENKLVLIDFTGSDWCGWCIKLKAEIFSTPEFNNYARTNLVLVEIDFPRFKPLSPELMATNEKMQQKYKAEGFPTIVVLDPNAKEIWRLGGYAPGTPADWIRTMDVLKVKPDEGRTMRPFAAPAGKRG
jgi:thioredoxin-related protein